MDINRLKALIGNNIYDLRMEYGLTQDEFAKKLGTYFSKGHISKIESGTIMPSAEFVRAVCLAFKISPYWILHIKSKLNDTTDREKKLLHTFRDLTLEEQDAIINLMNVMYKSSNP